MNVDDKDVLKAMMLMIECSKAMGQLQKVNDLFPNVETSPEALRASCRYILSTIDDMRSSLDAIDYQFEIDDTPQK